VIETKLKPGGLAWIGCFAGALGLLGMAAAWLPSSEYAPLQSGFDSMMGARSRSSVDLLITNNAEHCDNPPLLIYRA